MKGKSVSKTKYSTEFYIKNFFERFYKDNFSVDRFPDYCNRFNRLYESTLLSNSDKEFINLHFYLLIGIKDIPNGGNKLTQLNRKIRSLMDRGLDLLSQNWVKSIEMLEARLDIHKTCVDDLDISVLNIGIQGENALRREGINYISQLKVLSLDDLTSIKGINLTYTDFIYKELKKFGILINVPYVQKYSGVDDVNFRLRVLSFFKDVLSIESDEAEMFVYDDFDERLSAVIKSGKLFGME